RPATTLCAFGGLVPIGSSSRVLAKVMATPTTSFANNCRSWSGSSNGGFGIEGYCLGHSLQDRREGFRLFVSPARSALPVRETQLFERSVNHLDKFHKR